MFQQSVKIIKKKCTGCPVCVCVCVCVCMHACVCVCIFRCDLSPYGVGLSRGTGGEPYTCYQSELLASSH